MSRQTEWQKRQLENGECKLCHEKRVNALHCAKHAEAHRKNVERWRRKNGQKAWQQGKRGRPPIDQTQAAR